LILLVPARNALQHGIGERTNAKLQETLILSAQTLVPVERIELPTFGLQNRCSTAELNRQAVETIKNFLAINSAITLVATILLPNAFGGRFFMAAGGVASTVPRIG
jgi:hypothetical protein